MIDIIADIARDKMPQAQWIAQNSDGKWYAYEFKPTFEEGSWVSKTGRTLFIIDLEKPTDFSKNLYSINQLTRYVNQKQKSWIRRD